MALMDIKEVSAWLNVKPATLYAWVAERKIPALKIHGVIRFQRDVLEQWMQAFRTDQAEASTGRGPAPRPELIPRRRGHGPDNVDALIARAKAEAYSPSLGDQTHAKGRRHTHGSV